MAQEVWTADEIEVAVSGFFTTHHCLQTATEALGELILSAFSTSGVFRFADGRELVVRRTSWWRGQHELEEDGLVLGAARSRGFWRSEMDIMFQEAAYGLVPADSWSNRWDLVDDAGAVLLEICPRGLFRRGASLTIRGPLNTDLLVFAYYLVNARWQERGAAAAAAAGS